MTEDSSEPRSPEDPADHAPAARGKRRGPRRPRADPGVSARTRPCASSRPGSCVARTTGPASRSSAWSWTSARSRTSRRTRSPASWTPWSSCLPDARGSRVLARPTRRVHHPAARRDVGRATSPSTSPSSSRTSPARMSATARPAPPAPRGQYNVHLRVSRGDGRASRPAGWPWRLVNHLVAPDDPRPSRSTSCAELERLIRLAERQAFGPSTQALIDEAVEPRHPVHPPRPPLARPARSRRPPAADPGDDDVEDVGASRSTSRRTRA